ncbi:hypothetical protein ZWY2020_043590 [Hordeum vulgare]|nr:hypothetical protein ZWY2020_043590 [Hordeum vulgare]
MDSCGDAFRRGLRTQVGTHPTPPPSPSPFQIRALLTPIRHRSDYTRTHHTQSPPPFLRNTRFPPPVFHARPQPKPPQHTPSPNSPPAARPPAATASLPPRRLPLPLR